MSDSASKSNAETSGAAPAKGPRLWLRGLIFAALIAAASSLFAGAWAWRALNGAGPLTEASVIWFKPGTAVARLAAELEAEGAIRNARTFRLLTRLTGADTSLKAGEYEIPPRASVSEILRILKEGDALHYRITIPEGLTTRQIMALVDADPVLTGAITHLPGEGRLLPETYAFTRGETRDAMIRRMEQAQRELIAELWPDRATDLPFSTVEEALALASIVEKETALAEERPRVAAVFVNRLRRNMRLESDPTIIYGLTGGEPLGRGLRRSEIDRETPYNTYRIRGLPPTPIANPGRAAIEAVLNPPQTEDLYFVASGDGGHVFASTYAEHQRNVAAWRRLERARNGGR